MFLARVLRVWSALLMSSEGGIFAPGGGGACRISGRRVRPSCRCRVRCARASIGRCFLIGGEGVFVFQLRGRWTEESPTVRCLDESWALNEEREGKECGSLPEAGLAYGGAQATLRAARRLLYLHYETTGGRQASRESMEVGVEKKLFVVHRCQWTLCQKLSMLLSAEEFGVRRSAPYVSMGRRRPLAMWWHRKGLTPAPGEDRRLTKEKIAWAKDSLCLKWGVVLRAGVNPYPSHLTTLEGWKRWPSSSMEAIEGGDLWLGVHQWMSSVFGTEKETPMSPPFAPTVLKTLCSLRM